MKALRFCKNLWRSIGALLMLALLSLPASAQCAMCRAAFDGSSGAVMAKSLNRGIIILLIPPVAIFCAIFITAYKYRKAPMESSGDMSLK
ncbi:MAG: hypothetical protein QOF02_1859 [Blastocatellia bacterium]|jgi:hypothetical protein|nr:hypothetical protein [Blastocatellia bacterium]